MRWQIDDGSRDWHRWFAWYPVRLSGTNDKVWLEYVERKKDNCQGWIIPHYHAIGDSVKR